MRILQEDFNPSSNDHLLVAYVADLELEVNRLRKMGEFVRHEAGEMLGVVQTACNEDGASETAVSRLAEVLRATQQFAGVLRDAHDSPGYHPAHDQVVAIALRPLIEQVFRWQQRLHGALHSNLHVELTTESIEWFPVRFRHILDNLISNALKYRDPEKGEARVFVGLTLIADVIELRVSDNGRGMPWNSRVEAFELFYRCVPRHTTGLGVGLAVVKILVEQSGGTLTVESSEGQGTSFVVQLPRYDSGDYIN